MEKFKKCNRSRNSKSELKSRISFFWSIFYLLLSFGLYFVVFTIWSYIPKVDNTDNQNPNLFNAKNAQYYLKEITKVGQRVGGSIENEIIMINLLEQTVLNISDAALPIHKIDLEVQRGYGHLNIANKKNYPVTCVFRGIQNVVVKLTSTNYEDPANYLLINGHYDTTSNTPSASSASMVAIMLEILRKMTQSYRIHKHGIVFLFSGYEENNLQGSYAFISQHRWFRKVRAFINLEAASNIGRATLLQGGSNYPFLLDYYGDYVARPYGSVIGEELLNLSPHWTSYEMFKKFGNIPGIVIAKSTYGYLKHTKYDTYEKIPLESIQQAGQSMLELSHELADAQELSTIDTHRSGKPTYFDFMTLFFISYSGIFASLIYSFMLFLSVALLYFSLSTISDKHEVNHRKIMIEFFISFVVLLLSMACGAGLSVLISFIMDAIGRTMSWYTSTWLIFGLYYVPFLWLFSLGPLLYIKFKKFNQIDVQSRVIIFLSAEHLFHVLVLLILTSVGSRSAFILSLTTFAYSVTNVVNIYLDFKKNHWIYIHLIGQMIPFLYFSSLGISLYSTFISSAGKDDATKNPDQLISIFGIGFSFLMFSFICPLVSLLRRPVFFMGLFAAYFTINLIVAATPIGFPFKEGVTYQRYHLFHTERIFHNYNGTTRKHDYKIYLHPQDKHTPWTILNVVPEMANATLIGDECQNELYCGLPYYMNYQHKQVEISYWLPFTPPRYPSKPSLILEDKQRFGPLTRYTYLIKGTDHMGFYISPVANCSLIGWSFGEVLPSGRKWQNQSVHYVNYVYGIDDSESSFYLDIEHPINMADSIPKFHLTLVAHYMHHQEYITDHFKKFVKKFPKFINVVAHPSYLESWIY